ncbi:cytochrome c biogenesis protein [Hydrogenivirga caldilitoris]|uniref:Cytochrome c biogenesis protein n=1 Tax=Hydrogenivirga caldilitoris TaxID=246264 RepID=A0A497XP36_9AQUI|nr:cytochrome c biogenesis protein ResB [Hydrogenivirga caldilitoris]RLJ70717.1 cytochrome c biogenesis protein [Hydrogenivirga caldilitoris]
MKLSVMVSFIQSFGFFVATLILFAGVVIYGLFHLEEPNLVYWSIFGASALLFVTGLGVTLFRGFKDLIKDYRKHGNLFGFVYDLFASLKLAIFIMLLLGILSMLGSTYIQQLQPFEAYLDKFGPTKAVWFWKLWLNDVFHSWYYITLIVLLAVNLIVCSIKRLPRIWRQTFGSERVIKLDERAEKHLKPISVRIKDPKDIINLLVSKGFRVFKEEEGNRVYLFAEKGKYSRLGVYIVHIALLVIMAGALIDAIFGVRGFLPVPEGETSNIMLVGADDKRVKLPFAIHLKEFKIITYGDEAQEKGIRVAEAFKDAIASYRSKVEIINSGEKVAEGTVEVNEPFVFRSYRIFQASYGLTGGVREMGVVVVDKDKAQKDVREAIVGRFTVGSGKVTEFKDMLISVEKVVLNINNPQAGMQGQLAPAVVLKVLWKRKAYNIPVVYDPQITVMVYSEIKELEDFPYVFFMDGFSPQFYSGFQVSFHPGTNVIWLGSIVLVLGMMVAFYTVHRKVWVRIEGDTAKIAFYSHKFREEFRKSFLRELEEVHAHGQTAGGSAD